VREFVFVDDARTFGGGQGNVLRLARFAGESESDRSARVICPGGSELARRCRAARIDVADASFPAVPLRIPRAVLRLRRLLASIGPESIVVGTSLRAQVYIHAAGIGLGRTLRVVHYLPEQDSAGRLTTRLLLRRFGALVVVGENSARAYRGLRGVHVIVANTFLLPEELAKAAETAPPANDGPPVLGVLARLIPEKGVLELVSELAVIEAAWSSVDVGGKRESETYACAVEARLATLGLATRVKLLGHVDDLSSFFAAIDALVVPSVGNEGQPTVIVEALAHGRPAIVREPIWTRDFEAMPVYPYRDSSDLARVLSSLEPSAPDPQRLAEQFGPMQMLAALEAAAKER
jgi:glycosyltransferase involved in cell wall biosynthesis